MTGRPDEPDKTREGEESVIADCAFLFHLLEKALFRVLRARARVRGSPWTLDEPANLSPTSYQVRFRERCAFTMLLRGADPLDHAKARVGVRLICARASGAAMRDSTRILTSRPGSAGGGARREVRAGP